MAPWLTFLRPLFSCSHSFFFLSFFYLVSLISFCISFPFRSYVFSLPFLCISFLLTIAFPSIPYFFFLLSLFHFTFSFDLLFILFCLSLIFHSIPLSFLSSFIIHHRLVILFVNFLSITSFYLCPTHFFLLSQYIQPFHFLPRAVREEKMKPDCYS